MTVKFFQKPNMEQLLAKVAKSSRVRVYNLETKGAGELVRTPIQAGSDAVTIIAGGQLPAETVPKRKSTAERVRRNLRTTAARVRSGMAEAGDDE